MINHPEIANMTIKDVAKHFKVSTSTINRWRRLYGFPSCLIGQHRRFIWADILKWQKKHQEVQEEELDIMTAKRVLEIVRGSR